MKKETAENIIHESIKLEITRANYWQHFKAEKELGDYLPLNHPRRIALRRELNDLQIKMKYLADLEYKK